MRNTNKYLTRALITALIGLAALFVEAQIITEDQLMRKELAAHTGLITWMSMMPDGHTIVAGCSQEGGLLMIDTNTWSIAQHFALDGFTYGPRVLPSSDGQYLLLQEQFRLDGDANHDMRTRHAVIDATTGAVLVDVANAHDGALTADGTLLATLDEGVVTFRRIADATVTRSIAVPNATNAIALSPDAKLLAVSHRPTPELLATVPSVRNDKKAIKPALKYRQMVSFYSLPDGDLTRTINEIYDVVLSMGFTPDGSRLLIYSTPDTRLGARSTGMAAGLDGNMQKRMGMVDQVDAASGEPLRASCTSWMNEPCLAISNDGSKLALGTSEGHNNRKVQINNARTGDSETLIDLQRKHRDDVGAEEEHDGRVAYCWLPDGRIVIALGEHLGICHP